MREDLEWLEADGLGGFASGTVPLTRTRRYHALLLAARTPPTDRVVLVNGLEAWVDTPRGAIPLSSQRYAPSVVHPDGASRLVAFSRDPWPRWTYRLDDGVEIEHQVTVPRGAPIVALSWRLVKSRRGITLRVRPLLSGRETHALHRENGAFRFDALEIGERVRWSPYDGVPAVLALTNGDYTHEPLWYRNFLYAEEVARGLDCIEDLGSPGTFAFDLSDGEATMVLAADVGHHPVLDQSPTEALRQIRSGEHRRRSRFATRLHRAADAYIVQRGAGSTIVAGYPWFTDWGRDTFIALRGLAIAGSRLEDATRILRAWADLVSEGMLPNYFPESGREPEYNSVDASLWYVVVVHELIAASARAGVRIAPTDARALHEASQAILAGYAAGTRFHIHADDDGLLAAGEPGVQLTWMDAKVGDRVITPRIGKPVEVQALWINALRIGGERDPRWRTLAERGAMAFAHRFWNADAGCLYDVVDADSVVGRLDGTVRPNQIFAVGGLPVQLIDGTRARSVVDVVERRLWTPMGLRSLAPGEPGYAPHYGGGVPERDGAYHQGTVWPWLVGAFVDAWVRVRGAGPGVRRQAHEQFLGPLLAHLDQAGLGHVSEIADAEAPFTPRGCPFQAWSVGEVLRADRALLAESNPEPARLTMATGASV